MSPDRLGAASFEEAAASKVDDLDLDTEAFRAMFDLMRVSTRLFQDLESRVHRPAGWSLAGFRVMFTVWIAEDLEPREISRLSGISRAAVSSVLNTLERDGLIDRTRESDDRRLVTVRLTKDGRKRLTAAYAQQNARSVELLRDLKPAELARLTATLQQLLASPLPE